MSDQVKTQTEYQPLPFGSKHTGETGGFPASHIDQTGKESERKSKKQPTVPVAEPASASETPKPAETAVSNPPVTEEPKS